MSMQNYRETSFKIEAFMALSYQQLPVPDFNAVKVESSRKPVSAGSIDGAAIKLKDAIFILNIIGIDAACLEQLKVEAHDKFLINISNNISAPSVVKPKHNANKTRTKKPHYAHMFRYGDKLFFQAACCKPLKLIAASSGELAVRIKTLYDKHDDNNGGKLVVEMLELQSGLDVVIDMQRADSSRVQRYIFKNIKI